MYYCAVLTYFSTAHWWIMDSDWLYCHAFIWLVQRGFKNPYYKYINSILQYDIRIQTMSQGYMNFSAALYFKRKSLYRSSFIHWNPTHKKCIAVDNLSNIYWGTGSFWMWSEVLVCTDKQVEEVCSLSRVVVRDLVKACCALWTEDCSSCLHLLLFMSVPK